jgi:hypothetical protein
MNLFANNTGRESLKTQQTPEPAQARRAVRYAASDNAHAALQRQFPGMSFGVPFVGTQAVSSTVAMQDTTETGAQDESYQAA